MAKNPNAAIHALLYSDGTLEAADLNTLAATTASATELNLLDGLAAPGNATASKPVLLDANKTVAGIRRPVVIGTQAAITNVTAAHSGTVYTNEGASGAAVFAMAEAAVVGAHYWFFVMAAQALRIDPVGTETISGTNGAQGNAGKYLEADAVGEWVHIMCVKAGQWQVVGYNGTWTHEAG